MSRCSNCSYYLLKALAPVVSGEILFTDWKPILNLLMEIIATEDIFCFTGSDELVLILQRGSFLNLLMLLIRSVLRCLNKSLLSILFGI